MDAVVPQGRLGCGPGGDIVQLAEGGEVPHPRLVGSPCGGRDTQGLKGCELLGQADISITGVGVGLASA